MRNLFLLLALSLLLASAHARRKKDTLKEQAPAPDEQTKVVQSNRFFSEKETSNIVDVKDAETGKPLLFLLEPNEAMEKSKITMDISTNPVSVTLQMGGDKKQCKFKHYFSLCSLPNISSKEGKVTMSCERTPCEIHWKVIQPETIEVDGEHKINHLVSVNQQKNHAILKVYCTDPQLKTELANSIQLYTNSLYDPIDTIESQVIYLFNNEEKGELFITTTNKAIEACAEVILEHAEEQLNLKDEGVTFHDFISSRELNTYELTSAPSTDLMLSIFAHNANMANFANNTGIQVRFVGITNKKETLLSQLDLIIDNEKQYIDFSAVLKKPNDKYDKYEVHLKGTTEQFLIATINLSSSDTAKVQFEEESYFSLKKGEKINFKLIPLDKQVTNIEKQNIFVSDPKKFSLSKDSCPKEGCDFTVQALADAKGYIYVGEDIVQKKQAEIVLEEFEKSIKAKLREGEQKFYSYKLKANSAVQMIVNSPSVLIYAANKNKCQPKELSKCYEKQFNYHNPSIYESKEEVMIAFKVVALDNCEFVMTLLDEHEPYISLKDTEPFVYLMNDNQQQLIFSFKLNRKQEVSFNLIAPLNQMDLVVFNKQTLGKEDSTKESEEAQISMDGFVSYKEQDLKSEHFVIKVVKREEYRKKYVHFTLIATTKESNLRLEPGNPHYETLKPSTSRNYVFEFIPNKNIFLNFYTHNLQNNIELKASISSTSQVNNKSSTVELNIDRQTDVASIGTLSQKLCAENGDQCELLVKVQNNMDVEVDLTITLLTTDVIIELKDGIWQTYDINEAASTAHFYFLPKHEQHSVTIYYHSVNVDIKIAYALWKSDDTSISPGQWPFPYIKVENDEKTNESPLLYKPARFIHIQRSQMHKCWPHCVVLLSIVPSAKQLQEMQKKPVAYFNLNHDFKIMASNNYVEIPEKLKVDLIMNTAEAKYLLVDLKYYLEKNSLIFFKYLTLGSVSFRANVYSQKNPRCPTTESYESDFQMIGVQTELRLADIKKKMEENDMEDDKNPYICILAYSFAESKTSLEFVSEASDIKDVPIDTTTAVSMKAEETRLFQINAHFEYFLKISRNTGFPYISKKVCDPNKEDMQKCLQAFKSSTEKGEQLVNKIMAISDTPCQSCILFVKVYSKQDSDVTLHSQSKYVQVELKENQPLTDILAANEVNKYVVTGSRSKEVIVNIQILSGNLKVQLYDFSKVHINKTNDKGSSNIHIVVPSEDLAAEKKETEFTSLLQPYALSNFAQLHLIVEPENSKEPANYIVTYSTGEPTAYLEDGLITEYMLMPNKNSKFLYSPPSSERVYLYLSAADVQTLNNINTTIYSLNNGEDEEQKQALTPQRPTFMKKTVNPTMLIHLPGKAHYQILLQNKNSKIVPISIGVNNQEIIYLPINHEFPFRLENKEYIYFSVPVSTSGYVRFIVNKCSDCQPYVSYTDQYKDFVAESFEAEEQITDSLVYENIIKVKKAGGVYFKVRSRDDQISILTAKAIFSPTKFMINKARAGNKGNIQYQLLTSMTAEITYSGVVCDKNCEGQFTYSAIVSPRIEQIFSQLVCTSVSFDLLDFVQRNSPEAIHISAPRSSDNKIIFNYTLKADNEYIGIKAVNSKTGEIVYYPPVELINFSGKVGKVVAVATQQNRPLWAVAIIIVVSILWALIAYRRYKKKNYSYKPLMAEVQDTLQE